MTFPINSIVRVNNETLKSHGLYGMVLNSNSRKTEVKLPHGPAIEFLNHNLRTTGVDRPVQTKPAQPPIEFGVGDIVMSKSGQEARVTKVHSSQTGQYLNVELLGARNPQVQTWKAEGIKLISSSSRASLCSEIVRPGVTASTTKKEAGKFILWSPQSNRPPQVIHTTLAAAQVAQKEMAERYVNQEFYIMKAVSKVRMERKVEIRPVVDFF